MKTMSIEKLIEVELKDIPKGKLREIYDLIHYFKIGIIKEGSAEDVKALRIASEKKFAEIWKGKRTMSGKVIYRQREIVLTRFPFSNLTDFKVRPTLVLSKDGYNYKYADVIICGISSNLEESEYGIEISTESLDEGYLKLDSKIRVDAITNIEQDIILKKIGRLKSTVFQEVLSKIHTLFVDKQQK